MAIRSPQALSRVAVGLAEVHHDGLHGVGLELGAGLGLADVAADRLPNVRGLVYEQRDGAPLSRSLSIRSLTVTITQIFPSSSNLVARASDFG